MCLFSAEEEEAPMVEEGHQVYLQMGLFSMGIGRGGRFALNDFCAGSFGALESKSFV